MVGGFIWGSLADEKHIGRRHCVIWANAITFGCGFASAFSPNITTLILLRGFLGIGISGNTLMPYTLFVEILPSKKRGTWSTVTCWAWSFGAVLVVLLAWLILPSSGWRYLVLVASLPGGICLAISIVFLEESPMFFAMHGQRRKAVKVLQGMAIANGSKLPKGELYTPVVDKNNDEDLEDQLLLNHHKRARSRSIIKQIENGGFYSLFEPDIITTTFRLWFVWFSCAFCYYGTILVTTMLAKEDDSWESEECQNDNDNWGNGNTADYVFSSGAYLDILQSTWGELLASLVTTLFLDMVERKVLMTISFLVFSAMFFILAMSKSGSGYGEDDDDVGNTTDTGPDDPLETGASFWFNMAMLAARTTAAICLMPAIYVYTSEIYRTRQRAPGIAMGYIFARFGGILSPFAAQALFEVTYVGSMMVFCIVSLIAAIFCASFTQRTTGKVLRAH
eukprot:g4316.t1